MSKIAIFGCPSCV